MPDPSEQPTVLSLIIDSLHRVEQGVTRVETALLRKADKADIASLEARLDGHATRITALEREDDLRRATAEVHRERDQRSWFRRATWWKVLAAVLGSICTLVIAAGTIIAAIAAIHG